MRGVIIILALLMAGQLSADLVCEGVLGNSGEAGESLALGSREGTGIGVALDSQGTLWTRIAPRTLARFTVDGRQLATYPLPTAKRNQGDELTIVNDLLVLLIEGRLYTLPIDAEPGSAPELLNLTAFRMSNNGVDNQLALCREDGTVLLFDPVAATTAPYMTVTLDRITSIERTPDGAVWLVDGKGIVHKYVAGKEIEDDTWPRETTGRRENPSADMCHANGAWYGFSWYGTIRRYDAQFVPAPGVAIGGSSGWFIGTVPGDADLSQPRNVIHLRENLYVACGDSGVLMVLRWLPEEQRLTLMRRIGGHGASKGIVLDRQGRIFDGHGVWHWEDGPATPQRHGFFARPAGELMLLPGDKVTGPGLRYADRPVWIYGDLGNKPENRGYEPGVGLKEKGVASALMVKDNRFYALLLEPDGKGGEYRVGPDGAVYQRERDLILETAETVKEWHSLAWLDGLLYAAADGMIVEFSRDGDVWREQKRWQSWGEGEGQRFGGKLHLAADQGRLWVLDSERHRLLVFSAVDRQLVATFGASDQPGAELTQLRSPTTLYVAGNRAIVGDTGNYRLLKLNLTK